MSKPYNFFQQSEFGRTGSGIVSAYSGYFSGFLTPTGMFDTPRGYLVGGGDYERTWKDYQIEFSGNVSSNFNLTSSLSCSFSGAFYPVITGTPVSLDAQMTGRLSGVPIDAPTYSLGITGSVSSGFQDLPTYSLGISGAVDGFTIIPTLQVQFTGNVSSGVGDIPTYSVAISGNIVKFQRDKLSLNASLDYVEWDKGNVLHTLSFTNTGLVNCYIDFIGWSQEGV